MSKFDSICLAFMGAIAVFLVVPVLVWVESWLILQLSSMPLLAFSALISLIAAPVFYTLFRRMK